MAYDSDDSDDYRPEQHDPPFTVPSRKPPQIPPARFSLAEHVRRYGTHLCTGDGVSRFEACGSRQSSSPPPSACCSIFVLPRDSTFTCSRSSGFPLNSLTLGPAHPVRLSGVQNRKRRTKEIPRTEESSRATPEGGALSADPGKETVTKSPLFIAIPEPYGSHSISDSNASFQSLIGTLADRLPQRAPYGMTVFDNGETVHLIASEVWSYLGASQTSSTVRICPIPDHLWEAYKVSESEDKKEEVARGDGLLYQLTNLLDQHQAF